MTERHGCAIKK